MTKDVMNNNENSSDVSNLNSIFGCVIQEAQATTAFLNAMSGKIIELENELKKCHSNFPFKLIVKEEEEEVDLPVEERHQVFRSDVLRVDSKKLWALAWAPIEEGSKTYRLLLICEELEDCALGGRDWRKLKRIVFRKALLETDIATRREFSVYMEEFLSKFAEHIKSCRKSNAGEACYRSLVCDTHYQELKTRKASADEYAAKKAKEQEIEKESSCEEPKANEDQIREVVDENDKKLSSDEDLPF